MRLAQMYFFWAMFPALLVLAGFFYWTWRVKQKLISQFVQSRLLANLTIGVSHKRQILRLVLLTAAVAFVFLALARPQWGFKWEEAKQQGLDIVVAIDTSKSMLAEDVAPNRLTRAKLAALDLMRAAKSDRLGLVAFAGTAFLQSPLTLDEQAFRQSVETVDVGLIPQGGTALSEAIRTALTAFEQGNDNHKVMVLFTDGEDHDIDAETTDAAKAAAKAGMKIFTIGVGTPEGELLRVKNDQGQMDFVKDENGDAVKSHLNENLLRQIATTTGGAYLPLRGANPMDVLYQQALAPLPKSDNTSKLNKVYHERYHIPLAIAIVLLIIEVFMPERKRVRRVPLPKPSVPEAATVAALLFLFLPLVANASPTSAFKKYNQGKFDDAYKEYDRLSEQKTNDYRLHYNAGTAAYRAKELKSAVDHFTEALSSPQIASDLKAQEQTFYNLGNTLYEMGVPMQDQQKQQETWKQAIESYEHALALNSQDPDAKNNLQYVKKRLEQLQQQQQQQQKGDKNKDDKQDQQQQQQQDQQQNQKDKNDKDQQQQQQQDQAKQDQQNKDQQSKDQQSKDQQAKKNGDKQKQDQQQQQAQGKKGDEKDKQQQQQASEDKRGKEQQQQSDEAQQYYGRMSPQQARQLLDADRDDEKALVFSPENKPKQQGQRKLKDW
jgi:Ca-activated chloride channel homolog